MKPFYPMVLLAAVISAGSETQESLEAYARTQVGSREYGISFLGLPLGRLTMENKLTAWNGKAAFLSSVSLSYSFSRGKAVSRDRISVHTHYSLQGKGRILSHLECRTVDRARTSYIAYPENGKFVMKQESTGGRTEHIFPLPDLTLAHYRDLDRWLGGKPEKGSTFCTYLLSYLLSRKVEQLELTYKGCKDIPCQGGTEQVHVVAGRVKNLSLRLQLQSRFRLLEAAVGPILIRPGKKSKDSIRPIDLEKLINVPAKGETDVQDVTRVDEMRLRITGLGSFQLPVSHCQVVTGRCGDAQEILVRRDHRTAEKSPLLEEERLKYLAATPCFEVNHPTFRDLLEKILGNEADPGKAARRLQVWVGKNLKYSAESSATTALEILKNRDGDCSEHARLYVALARTAGIPAREVGGLVFVGGDRPCFSWHAWAEIHDGSQWITVDPTWNQFFVDGVHVKLQEESEDYRLLSLLGRMSIEVVSFKEKVRSFLDGTWKQLRSEIMIDSGRNQDGDAMAKLRSRLFGDNAKTIIKHGKIVQIGAISFLSEKVLERSLQEEKLPFTVKALMPQKPLALYSTLVCTMVDSANRIVVLGVTLHYVTVNKMYGYICLSDSIKGRGIVMKTVCSLINGK